MAARLGVAIAIACGCSSSTAPPPPISNVRPAPPRPAPRKTEIWIGVGYQPDAGSQWTLKVKIRRDAAVGTRLGTISYPSLGCSGELIRKPDEGSALVAIEHLTVNPEGQCVDRGTIRMTDIGDTLDWRWSYPTGLEAATATLHKQRR